MSISCTAKSKDEVLYYTPGKWPRWIIVNEGLIPYSRIAEYRTRWGFDRVEIGPDPQAHDITRNAGFLREQIQVFLDPNPNHGYGSLMDQLQSSPARYFKLDEPGNYGVTPEMVKELWDWIGKTSSDKKLHIADNLTPEEASSMDFTQILKYKPYCHYHHRSGYDYTLNLWPEWLQNFEEKFRQRVGLVSLVDNRGHYGELLDYAISIGASSLWVYTLVGRDMVTMPTLTDLENFCWEAAQRGSLGCVTG